MHHRTELERNNQVEGSDILAAAGGVPNVPALILGRRARYRDPSHSQLSALHMTYQLVALLRHLVETTWVIQLRKRTPEVAELRCGAQRPRVARLLKSNDQLVGVFVPFPEWCMNSGILIPPIF